MKRIPLLFSVLLIAIVGENCAAENWPGFRGPTGLGYTAEKDLPITWGGADNKNILWKSPLPGDGLASPIVWGDNVIVCTVRWPGDGSPQAAVMPAHHVTCYRAADGKMKWDTIVPPGPWLRSDFRAGSGGGYANSTPATDGKLIYCAFSSSVLAALDFEGKIAWRKEIIPFTFDVTIGCSPVLYGDSLIFLCSMAKPQDSKLMAMDKSTGKAKWEQPLPATGFSHTTPLVIDVNGKPQVLVLASGMKVTGEALQSFNPEDGHRLWWCWGEGESAGPAYGGGLVYFDSGRNGPGVCVDPTGSGDVSKTNIKWTVPQVPDSSIGSPVIIGDYVYRLQAPGVLKCWELGSGKTVYSQRLAGIGSTWASPIVDPAGRIYFANAGRSYVVQSGPDFKVLAINDLNDRNDCSAAVSAGKLVLVGRQSVYSIGQR